MDLQCLLTVMIQSVTQDCQRYMDPKLIPLPAKQTFVLHGDGSHKGSVFSHGGYRSDFCSCLSHGWWLV